MGQPKFGGIGGRGGDIVFVADEGVCMNITHYLTTEKTGSSTVSILSYRINSAASASSQFY